MIYNSTLSMNKPPVITAKLQRSVRSKRKYQVALYQDGRPVQFVHFGHPDFEDFTQHKDEKRKKNYIARHKPREHWHDIYTPGMWSRFLLWDQPTLQQAKKNITKMFGIKFI